MHRLKSSVVRRWDFTVSHHSWWRRLTPSQLFVGSFGLLILLGTVGLKVLPGLYTETPLTWEEALYTSTSAVCVTGLIVVDTATRFTPLGQGFVLLLIQLGGLGMIAFTSLIILALGGRLSLCHESVVSAAAESAPEVDPRHLVYDIIRFTVLIEAIGAGLLYLLWIPRLGWRGAIWPAVFHSVSAFCNAGFSTFSNSLIDFQESTGTLLVIAGLIVAGGLGFSTLQEISPWIRSQRGHRSFRVSLHSRLVLLTTAGLIVGGWLMFAVLEWGVTLKSLSPWHRLSNALFLSVTARTAGFNSIDYAQAAESSNFLTILLMMVGGSPGSTAGGIKTTTFALLGLLAFSRLSGNESPHIFSRTLRKDITDRAVGLSVLAFGIVTVGIFSLSITERGSDSGAFLDRMFEVVSAFNTVGLSTGISASMTSTGKAIIIAMMFVGRVGPLSFAAAVGRPIKGSAQFRYAYEEVMIG